MLSEREIKEENQESPELVGDLNWDGLHRPKIYYAVAATFCGLFLSVLDGTICNVALPAIAEELDVSPADSIWIVNAFQLVIMMLLLPFSTLGELAGYKKVYNIGVLLFTAGSLFCALASGFHALVAARVFQGIGSAMIMSVNTSLVKIIYPRRHLGKGVGLNATVVAIASVTGPSVAAGILSVATWEWLFAINVPLGILTWVLARKYLPDNPTRVTGRRFNWKDACLNAATFGLMIGCLEAYSHGADWHMVAVVAVVFTIVAAAYVRSQKGRQFPMLPFGLLRIPVFSMSVGTSIISFTCQQLVFISMPFMLMHTYGYDTTVTGLLMTASPVAIMFVAPMAGWMIGKVHPGLLGGVGIGLMSIACFSFCLIPDDVRPLEFVWRMMLFGTGFGLFQSPNNHILLSSAPPHRTGSAGGMLASASLVGQTTGAALTALLFSFSADGTAPHNAMLLSGILSLAGATLSSLRMKAGFEYREK